VHHTVEQVISAGVRRVPCDRRLTVGPVIERQIEAVVGALAMIWALAMVGAMDRVDGVLGQSWLVRHDHLLDYRNRRLVLDGAAPEGRLERICVRWKAGRRWRRWRMALRWIWQ
jgi:hypothetical protein